MPGREKKMRELAFLTQGLSTFLSQWTIMAKHTWVPTAKGNCIIAAWRLWRQWVGGERVVGIRTKTQVTMEKRHQDCQFPTVPQGCHEVTKLFLVVPQEAREQSHTSVAQRLSRRGWHVGSNPALLVLGPEMIMTAVFTAKNFKHPIKRHYYYHHHVVKNVQHSHPPCMDYKRFERKSLNAAAFVLCLRQSAILESCDKVVGARADLSHNLQRTTELKSQHHITIIM